MQHHHLCVRLDVDVCIDRGSWISLNYVARTTNISIVSNWKTINFYFFFCSVSRKTSIDDCTRMRTFQIFRTESSFSMSSSSTVHFNTNHTQSAATDWALRCVWWDVILQLLSFFFIILADYLNEAESCCSTSVRVYWAVPNSISITILGVVQLHKCPLLVLIDVEHRSFWCAHTTI